MLTRSGAEPHSHDMRTHTCPLALSHPFHPACLPLNTQVLAEAEQGLDEALTREELSHFQKQFFELYAQMNAK